MYPIKSCHAATVDGVPPKSLDVGKTGLEAYGVCDREYVIAENIDNRSELHFVTQRGWGSNNRSDRSKKGDTILATVQPNITAESLELKGPEGFGKVIIPARYAAAGEQRTVEIFGRPLPNAIDQGDEASEFFSAILGRKVRLLRANRDTPRKLKPHYEHGGAVNTVAAADGFPILLTNQTSLDFSHKLNGFEPGAVPLQQFRGNIEIDGLGFEPYDEDFWGEITVGSLHAFVSKACQRCPVPNVNQETGERNIRGQQVLRGRLGYVDDPSARQVVFGQNLNHVYEKGLYVRVGDIVQVMQRSNKRNFTLV